MINKNTPTLIKSDVNYGNKENNSLALNTNKVNSLKKFELFNDDCQPLPEPEELLEKEVSFKNKSNLVDLSTKSELSDDDCESLPDVKEYFENKGKKNINNFSTPIQEKSKKSVYFTDNIRKKLDINIKDLYEWVFGQKENNKDFSYKLETKNFKREEFGTPYYHAKPENNENLTFHHVIDIKKTSELFNSIFTSDDKTISNSDKDKLIKYIYLQLCKNNKILNNKLKNDIFNALKKLIKSDVSALSDKEKNLLDRIFLYFYGIGFFGLDEQYRPDELKAGQKFDALIKFIDRDKYQKLKEISESVDIKRIFKLLLDLSEKTFPYYEEEKWTSVKINNKNYEYPKVIHGNLEDYFIKENEIIEIEKKISSFNEDLKKMGSKNETQLMYEYLNKIKKDLSLNKYFKDNKIINEDKDLDLKKANLGGKFKEILEHPYTEKTWKKDYLEELIKNEAGVELKNKIDNLQKELTQKKDELRNIDKPKIKAFVQKTPNVLNNKLKDMPEIYKKSK